MVWLLLFIETRRVFGLLFLYRQEFIELKILGRPRMQLVFFTPSNLKRSPFKGIIPKGNSNKIYNRLVLYGFILMKIYFLGNWANNRFYWNPKDSDW
jgi:hypothetical protein